MFLCLYFLVTVRRKIIVATVLVWHINYGCHGSQEADRQGNSRTQYTSHNLPLVSHFSKISSTNESYRDILTYCHKLETKPPTQDHGWHFVSKPFNCLHVFWTQCYKNTNNKRYLMNKYMLNCRKAVWSCNWEDVKQKIIVNKKIYYLITLCLLEMILSTQIWNLYSKFNFHLGIYIKQMEMHFQKLLSILVKSLQTWHLIHFE